MRDDAQHDMSKAASPNPWIRAPLPLEFQHRSRHLAPHTTSQRPSSPKRPAQGQALASWPVTSRCWHHTAASTKRRASASPWTAQLLATRLKGSK